MQTILVTVAVFLLITLLLVAVLLVAKKYMVKTGKVTVDINNGERKETVQSGVSLLSALADKHIFLPSACGGKGRQQRDT
ncbi:MAG TPA: NADH:ubiquinone reductase (Na(+)-transporting) subunit F, partial [Muribaculaceae bacterium]|nr:NADH:ubiquinone reductase (Na(+)-transporting) subunit F [Muribaculaceae bacterium]